jgi:hypothetical protein
MSTEAISWIIVVLTLAFGIGANVMSLPPPNDVIAKACFTVGLLALCVRVSLWLFSLKIEPAWRCFLAFVIFGVIGTAWFASFLWVNKNQAEAVRLRSVQASVTSSAAPPLVGVPPPMFTPFTTHEKKPLPEEKPMRKKPTPSKPAISPKPTAIQHPAVSQTMIGSPGGMQAGRDINVGIDRQLSSSALNFLQTGFRGVPCSITVGTLSLGGEPDRLASQLFDALGRAGCNTQGVMHGVGFASFNGIRLLVSPSAPQPVIDIIKKALELAGLAYNTIVDSAQPAGVVYIYVGYKP